MSDDPPAAAPQRRLRELFEHAIGLDPAQRDTFLREQCGDNAALRAHIDSLLQHDERVEGDFLSLAAAALVNDSNDAATAPQTIGRYRILSVLGHGGMGTVYEAEQDHPSRKVALKVIRPGWMSPAMLRRFEYEADLLARLDHPGIARIFDAGMAETGSGSQPYFAMELIQGTRLDEYLRGHDLPLKQRLQLLIDICQAVHHAHTKGVIHRDLKPANILITADGKPKVLDFGVARATDADVQAAVTVQTQSGQLVGTLPYMSPEQAAGKVRELDTSCDVYALGVIAYELLSGGKLPYAVADKPLHEAVRVICEDEPSRLSSIDKSLRGDVETIVQKALEKDKTRRYHTAGEFAADIKRYLDYEPIAARRPSTWYQLRRFARRNKLLVGGLTTIMVLLAAGVVTSSWFAIASRRERAQALAEQKQAEEQAVIAQAINDFFHAVLMDAFRDQSLGNQAAALEATRQALRSLDQTAIGDHPFVEARVRLTIGETLVELDRYDEADPQLRRAVHIYRQQFPTDEERLGSALYLLAVALKNQGKLDEAEKYAREALDTARAVLLSTHDGIRLSVSTLGQVLYEEGRFADAEPLLREAMQISRAAQPPRPRDVAADVSAYGALLSDEGRFEQAAPLLAETLAIRRQIMPPGHPLLIWNLNALAGALYELGKIDDAESLSEEALASARKSLPPEHAEIGVALNNLGLVALARNKPLEAEHRFREALEIAPGKPRPPRPEVARIMNTLAGLLAVRGELDEAERMFQDALLMQRQLLPAGHPDIARTEYSLEACRKAMAQRRRAAAPAPTSARTY